MRLAILASHPIQYYAPLYRELAKRVDLTVFYAHRATPAQQAAAGFGAAFDWDVDLFDGYSHSFLRNVAVQPGADHFSGCDTPDIGPAMERENVDALLVMGWHLKTFWQGIFAAKHQRIRLLVRGDSHLGTRRHWSKRAIKRLLYPPLLRLFDAALYVGERNRAYYEHYRYPARRLFFSPHCVDNAWFAQRATAEARAALRAHFGVSDDAFVALFAGKLLPFKRPGDVIAAAALCRAGGLPIEVMIAGSGELEESLVAEARRAGVPLHMLGFCNQSKMPLAYAASDVLVLPSNRETWGLVANEALACSRPVIVSDACGCAPDLAAYRGVGATFPVGDVEKLARTLTAFVDRRRDVPALERAAHQYSLASACNGILAATEYVTRYKRLPT